MPLHSVTPHTVAVHIAPADGAASLRADVRRGLTDHPRWLPPKWFYDAEGGKIFDEITELDEYYPTRTERALLTRYAPEIAAAAAARTLVELGSGSSAKTVLLLDALRDHGRLETYVPQDVSETSIVEAAALIAARYPEVEVYGVVSDFMDGLPSLPDFGDRLVVFLGGTIGNLVPAERSAFFASLKGHLNPGEHVLLGIGLVIDEASMVAAYDDARGVTARFNRNVLHVMNRELGADFDVDSFEHVAVWDAENEWIEMRLRGVRPMSVAIPGADLTFDFAAGEEVRTEISAKFRLEAFAEELAANGLEPVRRWTDPERRFALVLAKT